MATHQLLRGKAKLGSLFLGGGTLMKKILIGTTSLNPASIAATTRGSVTFTVTGVRLNDVIVMNPPTALNAGLIFVGAQVSANDTVIVYLYNTTAGAIDDVALTWTYTWIKVV